MVSVYKYNTMSILKMRFALYALVLMACFGCQNSHKSTLKVAVMADLHVSPGNVQVSNMEDVISQINTSDYDFVIVAGDVTNAGGNDELECVHTALSKLEKPYFSESPAARVQVWELILTNWTWRQKWAGLTYRKPAW